MKKTHTASEVQTLSQGSARLANLCDCHTQQEMHFESVCVCVHVCVCVCVCVCMLCFVPFYFTVTISSCDLVNGLLCPAHGSWPASGCGLSIPAWEMDPLQLPLPEIARGVGGIPGVGLAL